MRLQALLLLPLLALCAFASEESNVEGYVDGPNGEKLALCKAGYTGPDCKNALCTNKTPLHKHATNTLPGDYITFGFSQFCSDTFQLPVDSAMARDVLISVTGISGGGFPRVTLTSSNGTEVSVFHRNNIGDREYDAMYRDLVPGVYNVKLSSDADMGCSVAVSSMSALSVDGGFVTDMRNDNVQNGKFPTPHQGIVQGPTQGIPSYLAFNVNNLGPSASVDNVTFITGDFNVQIPNPTFKVTYRYRCNAPSIITRPFTCPSAGIYFAVFSGIDTNGNYWQRAYKFNCDADLNGSTTPGPTFAPTPPPTSCDNGGILVNRGQPNATCYCGQYLQGSRCEFKRCLNDGELSVDGKCICGQGYQGEFCTEIVCATRPGKKFNPKGRAITFVVRGSSSMGNVKASITDAARNIITQSNFVSQETTKAYILVVFNNHKLLYKNSFDNGNDFLSAVSSINYGNDTMCFDSVLDSISSALVSTDAIQYPLSPIFVFTDALSDDSITTRLNLQDLLSAFRGPVFFTIPTGPNSGCKVDHASTGYKMFSQLAQYSQGIVLQTSIADMSEIVGQITALTEETNVILSNDFLDTCNDAPAFQSIFKDESSNEFVIYGTGDQMNVSVVDPSRKVLVPSEVKTVGNLFFARYKSSKRGNFLVKVATNGSPCQYRVIERKHFDVYFGTSHGLLDDFSNFQPFFNKSTGLVAHMNGIIFSDTTNVYTEATVWTNDAYDSDKRVVLYASNGVYRDGCDYNLFYGSWTCTVRDMPFYVTIFLDNREGFTVERTITGMCKAKEQIHPPNAGNCLNGGVTDRNLIGRNGTCLCPPGYQGDKCQTIVCQNGGASHESGYCDCPTGFAGQFCEVESCYETNNGGNFGPNYKSISFFVHDTLFTRSAIQSMLASTPRMLQGFYHQHPEWIVHYQLVRFNENSYEALADTDDPVVFAQEMANLYDRNEKNTEFSCKNLNILEPLVGVLNSTGIREGGLVFVFVNGLMRADPVNMENLMEQTQVTGVSLNFVQMSGNPCGQSLSHTGVTTMMSLATSSGGEFIQAMGMDAGNVLTSLPYLYSSSLIYENYYEDCASAPRSFYFPVDSRSQAFTVNFIGDIKGKPEYKAPERFPYNPVDLYNSVGMASRMQLVTRDCDDGWSLFGADICVKSFKYAETWQRAHQLCKDANSLLPIEFSKKDNSDLDIYASSDYWIGLNDLEKVGTWEWASRSRRYPFYLNMTGYTDWAPNQNINDTAKRCVFKKLGGAWYVDDCASKKPFICMKSSYDYNYFPGAEGRHALPRGMWKVSAQTYEGPCLVKVRAQSGIRLFMRYSTSLHIDDGGFVMNPNATNNHIVAHITGLDAPVENSNIASGALEFAQMYTNSNMSMVAAVPFYPRIGCTYSYVSRPFSCPAGALQVIASGVDSWGYTYQRIHSALCYSGDSTHSCENGGVFDKKIGGCICKPNYMGDRCEVPICVFGQVTAGFSCECYYGYKGRFCEKPMCTRHHNNTAVDSSTGKTMVIVFDGTSFGLQTDVIKNFQTLLSKLNNAATNVNNVWFQNYVGVIYRDSSAAVPISPVFNNTNFSQFVKDMWTELTGHPSTATAASPRPILGAINAVMDRHDVVARSQLFLITSVLPSDLNSVDMTMDMVARTHTYINTFLMGDSQLPGNVPYNDTSMNALLEVTFNSGGNFYQVPDYNGLSDVLTTDVGTLYDNFYIATRYEKNCSSVTEYIEVSSQSTMLTFDLFAANPTVTIRDPSGAVYTATNIVKTKTNYLAVVNNNGLPPGLWSVTIDNHVTSPGACLINVRGVSLNDVVSVAYTDDTALGDGGLHSDYGMLSPMAEEFNAIVVKSTFGTAKYAQIYSGSERKLYFSSALINRVNCDYSYITEDLFICPQEKMFRVAIDGVDNNDHPYRRVFTAHCA